MLDCWGLTPLDTGRVLFFCHLNHMHSTQRESTLYYGIIAVTTFAFFLFVCVFVPERTNRETNTMHTCLIETHGCFLKTVIRDKVAGPWSRLFEVF
jgi:hypothetical protein